MHMKNGAKISRIRDVGGSIECIWVPSCFGHLWKCRRGGAGCAPRGAVASRKCKLTHHPAHKEVQYEAQTNHLRHSKFIALRDDKDRNNVRREPVASEA